MENKKRKRTNKKNNKRDDSDNDDMDIDDEEQIGLEAMPNSELVNVEFTFSNIVEENFESIRNLIKPLFEYEDINPSDLFDVMLSQHEDVGTTIKSENDVFAVYSYVPLSFYKKQPQHNRFIDKFYSLIKLKLKENTVLTDDLKQKVISIIDNNKLNVGLVVNERAFNMPQETVPPAFELITKEIGECKEFDEYDKRYDFDYVIVMSKFVKIIQDESKKRSKKIQKVDTALVQGRDSVAYYKFEMPLFIKESEVSFEYKIPYNMKNMEYLENKNEPQYVSIAILKAQNYFRILKNELHCDI